MYLHFPILREFNKLVLILLGVGAYLVSFASCAPIDPCDAPMSIGMTISCLVTRPMKPQEPGQSTQKAERPISSEELEKLRKDAIEGGPEAQYHLGIYMFDKERAKSWVWFCRAAMQRWYDAQIALGTFYEYGVDPVEPDYVKAMMWYLLASPAGRQPAQTLADEMTPSQIAQAEQMARDWKPGDCPSAEHRLGPSRKEVWLATNVFNTTTTSHSHPGLEWPKGVGSGRSQPFGLIRCAEQRWCIASGRSRP